MIGISISGTGGSEHYLALPPSMTTLAKTSAGIANVVFSFTGHIAYPQMIAEMKRPEDFPKALRMNQIAMVVMYCTIAGQMYWFGGQSVLSPALNSAPGTWASAAWGLAVPTIIIAGVLPAIMLNKLIYKAFWTWMGKPEVQHENGYRAVLSWGGFAACLWTLACIIANGIPNFSGLVALVGAMLASWLALGFPAMTWFRIDFDLPTHVSFDADKLSQAESQLDGEKRDEPDSEALGGWKRFARQSRINFRRYPIRAAFLLVVLVFCIASVSDECLSRLIFADMHLVRTRHVR